MGKENHGFRHLTAYSELTALEMAAGVRRGDFSPTELTRAALARMEEKNGELNAVIAALADRAFERAAAVERALARGENPGPLAGVPITVKDNICLAGYKTTCASRMLESFVPPYSAAAVDALDKSGMIIVGKANLDEFAMGSSGETSIFGPALCPLDTRRTAGGSSSGSAAAVAGGFAPLSLGTDTGGSARLPAAYCGLFGLKPTYGAVSRRGLIAHASAMDQISPLGKSAGDLLALLAIIAHPDPGDATCTGLPPEGEKPFDFRGLRIALPQQYATKEPQLLRVIEAFEAQGARVEPVDMPELAFAPEVYAVLSRGQAYSNLSRYDGLRFGSAQKGGEQLFGEEVQRRLALGAQVTAGEPGETDYFRGLSAAGTIRAAFDRVLEKHRLILTPASPVCAPFLGQSPEAADVDRYAPGANLAGLPALSFPTGFWENGLPWSVQLIGRRFDDRFLLRTAQGLTEACK